MNIFDFIKEALSDTDGAASSKRLITVLALVALLSGYVANTWFGATINKEYIDALMYVVMTGLGVTASEKFATAKTV